MNSLQEKYFRLLIELTEICDGNGIPYRLHGYTVKMACLAYGYMKDSIDTKIEMDVEAAERLVKYMESHSTPDRILEYWGNHGNYPGFSLKYSDTNTLYLPLGEYGNHLNAIGIEIIPLRKYPQNPWKRRFLMALENGWELNRNYFPPKSGLQYSVCKLGMGILTRLIGKKRVSKFLWKFMVREYKAEAGDRLCFREPFKRLTLLPEDTRDNECIVFEGHAQYIPVNPEQYLRTLYKKDWRSEKNLGEKPGPERIVDRYLSFSEFNEVLQKNGINLNSYIRWHRKNKKMIAKRAACHNQKIALWKEAVKIGKVIQDEKFYLEQQEYRKNLIENFAYGSLTRHLVRFEKSLSIYNGRKYSEYFNTELLPVYNTLLQVQGKTKL